MKTRERSDVGYLAVDLQSPQNPVFLKPIGGQVVSGTVDGKTQSARINCGQNIKGCPVYYLRLCLAYNSSTGLSKEARVARGHMCGEYQVNENLVQRIKAKAFN